MTMSIDSVLAVGAGGFVGAPSRYLVDRFLAGRRPSPFPLGTFAINVAGSLLLGFLAGIVSVHAVPRILVAGIGTGFCGAFTTFSTFALEAVSLLEVGQLLDALRYVAASLVVGLLAVAAGFAFGQLL